YKRHGRRSSHIEALMGFTEEEGPSMRLAESKQFSGQLEVTPITSWMFSYNNNCTYYNVSLTNDEDWHFVAMSYSLTSLIVYTDGNVSLECHALDGNPVPNQWTEFDLQKTSSNSNVRKAFAFGRFSLPSSGEILTSEMETSMPLAAKMDDARVYLRALSVDELNSVYGSAPQQPLDSLLAWFDFGNGGPSIEARYTSMSLDVYTVPTYLHHPDGTYLPTSPGQYLPTYITRTVLIYLHHPGSTYPPTSPGQYLPMDNTYLPSKAHAHYAHLTLHSEFKYILVRNATVSNSEGQVSSVANDAGAALILVSPGVYANFTQLPIVVNSTDLNLLVSPGYFGNITFQVQRVSQFTLTPETDERTDYIHLFLHIKRNWRPQAGSAGYAISCDGENDYMYAPYFRWPVGNYTSEVDNITRFGGGPVTVEGWVYIIKDRISDGAIWAIASGEQAKTATDGTNPYKRTGRFVFSMPSSGRPQQYRFDVGSLSRTTGDTTHLGGTWAHFANVHSQVSGTYAAVYLNGELISETHHDHMGVGTPHGLNQQDQTPNQQRVE
ncbi:hypothetical protein SARC_10499, partial [Sphaeroforma arctica JP610]